MSAQLENRFAPDLEAAKDCAECEGTGWVWEPCHKHADFCPQDCNSDIPCGECQAHAYERPDEFDAIPWFTEKDAQQALERMHAWASTADPLTRLVWDLLDDTQRLNLARVALELRPRDAA
jgi:hypothetical protein